MTIDLRFRAPEVFMREVSQPGVLFWQKHGTWEDGMAAWKRPWFSSTGKVVLATKACVLEGSEDVLDL